MLGRTHHCFNLTLDCIASDRPSRERHKASTDQDIELPNFNISLISGFGLTGRDVRQPRRCWCRCRSSNRYTHQYSKGEHTLPRSCCEFILSCYRNTQYSQQAYGSAYGEHLPSTRIDRMVFLLTDSSAIHHLVLTIRWDMMIQSPFQLVTLLRTHTTSVT
jgi:hypothetical protein